ncbi:MAG TPA: sigma-70 family RNA polymerase sigma factor [Thermoanaerobaculia bacterium]|nr:sigma-70 family RNA polymerase sigma factor [Thermoanaerobaculia bacterium]
MHDETPGVPDFDALYRQYRQLLLSIATSKFHVAVEDAESLVHDVFVSLMTRYHMIRNMRMWLVGAICNACRYRLRQVARGVPLEEEMADSGHEPPYIDLLSARAMLTRVTARDRRVIELRFAMGMTAREIGRTLGCTPRAADRRLRRALERAAAHFDVRGDTLRPHDHP